LLVVVIAGLAQSDGQAPPAPIPPAKGAPVERPAKVVNQGFPPWATAKAFVQRDGETNLRMRAELPCGRFLKLLDADGKAVFIHEFVTPQPPPFTVEVKDVRVYDTRGRARPVKEWVKGLTEETLVLLEFRTGEVEAKQFAEAYRIYREDLVVLV